MEYEHGREQFFRKEQINNLTIVKKKKKKALTHVQKNANGKDWEGDFCKYV